MDKILENTHQYDECRDLVKSRFQRLREMFYRLAADKCGDPAYPNISLTTLVELLALFGTNSLKTVLKPTNIGLSSPEKAAGKESKLKKK